MPSELSLHVVGAAHPNEDGSNRMFEILLCRPGDPVQLVLEPKNPADANAVAVFSQRGIRIGYLAADRAPWIGSKIRLGADVQAIFQERTQAGAAVRVNLEGAAPRLPVLGSAQPKTGAHLVAPRAADPDSGFWPDDEWPDQ